MGGAPIQLLDANDVRTNQAREQGAKEDSDRGRWAKIADSLLGDAARRHTVARGSKDRLTK